MHLDRIYQKEESPIRPGSYFSTKSPSATFFVIDSFVASNTVNNEGIPSIVCLVKIEIIENLHGWATPEGEAVCYFVSEEGMGGRQIPNLNMVFYASPMDIPSASMYFSLLKKKDVAPSWRYGWYLTSDGIQEA